MDKTAIIRKVLIITYYWPPSGGAGVQRWLKFAKYLHNFGWEPVIYTPENPEAPALDHSLEKDIPSGTTVLKQPIIEPYSAYKRFIGMKPNEKVNAGFLQEKEKPKWIEGFSVWLRGNFFIPDARMFWIRPSTRYLLRYLKNNPVDAIVSTGPPHSMHLIALEVSKKTGIPWLADFRDPWTGIDFYHQLKLTKLADLKHRNLEMKVLSSANAVTVISSQMRSELNSIYARHFDIVTNGFDEEDIPTLPAEKLDNKFTISHIGSINASRNPELLWQVLAQMVNENTKFSASLNIKLVGKTDISVLKSIEKNKLTEFVTIKDYLPHSDVIPEIQKSQVLLLLINNTPNAAGILTGKIFEYLGSGRPVFCIGPEKGDAADLLNENNAGRTADYKNELGMKEIITNYYSLFCEQKLVKQIGTKSKFSRKSLTSEIAEILNNLISEKQRKL